MEGTTPSHWLALAFLEALPFAFALVATRESYDGECRTSAAVMTRTPAKTARDVSGAAVSLAAAYPTSA